MPGQTINLQPHLPQSVFKFHGGALRNQPRRCRRVFNLQNKLTWRANPKLKLSFETDANWSVSDAYVHNWNQEGYVDRLHLFERLELSGETIDGQQTLYYVSRGTLPVKHGPWYESTWPRTRNSTRRCDRSCAASVI